METKLASFTGSVEEERQIMWYAGRATSKTFGRLSEADPEGGEGGSSPGQI